MLNCSLDLVYDLLRTHIEVFFNLPATSRKRQRIMEKPKFSCLYCGDEVSGKQHALKCDLCSGRQHRRCGTGITLQQYRKALRDDRSVVWTCWACSGKAGSKVGRISLPISSSLELSDSSDQEASDNSDDIFNMAFIAGSSDNSTVTSSIASPTHEKPSLPAWFLSSYYSSSDNSDDSVLFDSSSIASPTHGKNLQPSQPSLPACFLSSYYSSSDNSDDSVLFNLRSSTNQTLKGVSQRRETVLLDNSDSSSDSDDSLLDDVFDSIPPTYKVLEGLSQRGRSVLVDSQGYSYSIKKTTAKRTFWRCTVRNSHRVCPCTVSQQGNIFTRGWRTHNHLPKRDEVERRQLRQTIKTQVIQQPLVPASKIAKDVFSECGYTDVKISTMTRMANRVKQTERLK